MLKYYLPLTIIVFSLGIVFLIFINGNHTAVLRYFAGEVGIERKGKIIEREPGAIVKKDGIEQNEVTVFEDQGKIYMVSPKIDNSGFYTLIIDRERESIFVPIRDCHEILFSKYLVEAECGQRGDYYSSEKKGAYDVKFFEKDLRMNFQLPAEYNNGKVVRSERVEIIFTGE